MSNKPSSLTDCCIYAAVQLRGGNTILCMKVAECSRHIIKKIGLNVGRMLDQRGMTQSELSRRADVDRSHLNGLICGSRNVSIDFLVKIANGLDVPLGSFFEGLDDETPEAMLRDVVSAPNTNYEVMNAPR